MSPWPDRAPVPLWSVQWAAMIVWFVIKANGTVAPA